MIARLAQAGASDRRFHRSALLKLLREPLIVSGELGYPGPTSLDRRVTTPYREHTAIRGESVKVEREGEKPRSFALKHAPELRGLAVWILRHAHRRRRGASRRDFDGRR